MSDLKRSHSEKSAELEHRLVQAWSEGDDLLAQMEDQATGMASAREELRAYAAECSKLRRVPVGAGGCAPGGHPHRAYDLESAYQSNA